MSSDSRFLFPERERERENFREKGEKKREVLNLEMKNLRSLSLPLGLYTKIFKLFTVAEF